MCENCTEASQGDGQGKDMLSKMAQLWVWEELLA